MSERMTDQEFQNIGQAPVEEGWTTTAYDVVATVRTYEEAKRARSSESRLLARVAELEEVLQRIEKRFIHETLVDGESRGLPSKERAPSLSWAMYDDARRALENHPKE